MVYVVPGSNPSAGILEVIQLGWNSFTPPWQTIHVFKLSPGEPVWPGSVPSLRLPDSKDSKTNNAITAIKKNRIDFFMCWFNLIY
jgi:hypothetical protein